MENIRKPKYPLGTVYTPRGKVKRVCTIVDIHYTINSKGEQVKFRYVSTHEIMGQTVYDYDVVETSIILGDPIVSTQNNEGILK